MIVNVVGFSAATYLNAFDGSVYLDVGQGAQMRLLRGEPK